MKNVILTFILAIQLTACANLPDLTHADKAAKAGDYKTAIQEWNTLSTYGYAEADLKLGQAYEKGHGVEKDLNLAEFHYLKATAKQNPRAMFSLGRLYERQHKIEQAQQYYQKAAALGLEVAQEKMKQPIEIPQKTFKVEKAK
jgi:TPR repeat protein